MNAIATTSTFFFAIGFSVLRFGRSVSHSPAMSTQPKSPRRVVQCSRRGGAGSKFRVQGAGRQFKTFKPFKPFKPCLTAFKVPSSGFKD
jgi:hypothetical protein